MDNAENLLIHPPLQKAFDKNGTAFMYYQSLTLGYKKSFLRWLATAKTEPTVLKRVAEIILLYEQKIKSFNKK